MLSNDDFSPEEFDDCYEDCPAHDSQCPDDCTCESRRCSARDDADEMRAEMNGWSW